MARRRKRNPKKNHSGLGAFVGSVIGGVPGALWVRAGSTTFGGVLAEAGSIVGGAVGGYAGAKPDRKRRGAIGGAIGGLFTPLGAALGGYIGGLKPDKRRNPSTTGILLATGGALLAGGAAAGGYLAWKKKREREKELGPSVPEEIPEDAWDRESPYRVNRNTTYTTTGWTFFPNPQLGIIVGRLEDPDNPTINASILKSEMWLGGRGAKNDLEIFTGDSPGYAEILLLSGDDRTTLSLLIE